MSPNRQMDRRTDRPTDYSNPRCACAPRVNYVKIMVPSCVVRELYRLKKKKKKKKMEKS